MIFFQFSSLQPFHHRIEFFKKKSVVENIERRKSKQKNIYVPHISIVNSIESEEVKNVNIKKGDKNRNIRKNYFLLIVKA